MRPFRVTRRSRLGGPERDIRTRTRCLLFSLAGGGLRWAAGFGLALAVELQPHRTVVGDAQHHARMQQRCPQAEAGQAQPENALLEPGASHAGRHDTQPPSRRAGRLVRRDGSCAKHLLKRRDEASLRTCPCPLGEGSDQDRRGGGRPQPENDRPACGRKRTRRIASRKPRAGGDGALMVRNNSSDTGPPVPAEQGRFCELL